MAASNPVWLTILIGIGTALIGVGARTYWEEHRDFLGARRVVIGELRANAEAARMAAPGVPNLGHQLSDTSYRNVQLILARRLPHKLYRNLELAYSQLTPQVKAGIGRAGFATAVGDTGDTMDRLAGQLDRYRPWTRTLSWWRALGEST